MVTSIIRDSPLLAGAIAILAAIFVFLMIAIMTAHRKPREEREEARRRRSYRGDPDFDGDDFGFDDLDRDYGPRGDAPDRRRPERRQGRFGFVSLTLAFVVGAGLGTSGWVNAPDVNVGKLVESIFGRVVAGPSTAGEPLARRQQVAEAAPEPPIPRPAPKRQRMRDVTPPGTAEAIDEGPEMQVAAVPAGDLDTRLNAFVARLQGEVPKPVGPMTVLASVNRQGESVTLGYNISRVPTEKEVAEIQSALRSSVVDTFCKGQSEEARYLNDNGVEFRLVYTDKDGRMIARVTAEPRFCEKAG